MNRIDLEISNPCNEHCLHCYRICQSTKKGFLSAAQAEDILKQAKELGASQVTITGGESFLNPEWRDIVSIADRMEFRISLFTNGSLMNSTDADFIKTVKHLKEVQFSLYGLDHSVHDRITGLSGSCEKTLNAIAMMKKRSIPIFISCPMMKENKDEIPNVMRWCDKEKISSCSDIFIFSASDYTGSNLIHRLSAKELDDFFQVTMQNNGELSYVWGKSSGNQDLSKILFYSGAAESLCVSGDGNIYPMIGWYEKLGNIKTVALKDIYNNSPLLKELRTIKVSDFPECVSCGCSDCCDFCCSPHLCANGGKLMRLDKSFCDFIKQKKMYIARRDTVLGRLNGNKPV